MELSLPIRALGSARVGLNVRNGLELGPVGRVEDLEGKLVPVDCYGEIVPHGIQEIRLEQYIAVVRTDAKLLSSVRRQRLIERCPCKLASVTVRPPPPHAHTHLSQSVAPWDFPAASLSTYRSGAQRRGCRRLAR